MTTDTLPYVSRHNIRVALSKIDIGRARRRLCLPLPPEQVSITRLKLRLARLPLNECSAAAGRSMTINSNKIPHLPVCSVRRRMAPFRARLKLQMQQAISTTVEGCRAT